jgi:hypothetical protein
MPLDIAAHTTKSTIASELPAAPTVASPVILSAAFASSAYIPPHKRASFDFGARRPFADVGNAGSNRDSTWQAKASFQTGRKTDHKRRLSSQVLLQTPALLSECDFHQLGHRPSLPKDMRRHARANTDNSATASKFVNEGRWVKGGPEI